MAEKIEEKTESQQLGVVSPPFTTYAVYYVNEKLFTIPILYYIIHEVERVQEDGTIDRFLYDSPIPFHRNDWCRDMPAYSDNGYLGLSLDPHATLGEWEEQIKELKEPQGEKKRSHLRVIPFSRDRKEGDNIKHIK